MFGKKKEVEAKTYDEWNKEGYQVIKGMQMTGRNREGVATFTKDQVKVKPVRRTIYDVYGDLDDDCYGDERYGWEDRIDNPF